MKHIVLTGGGTAGHVTPNIALLPSLKEAGYQISYIGSVNGIERQLISELQIPYYAVSSGKLRRYLSLENITDMFRVLKGMSDAKKILKKLKPDIVFSKGGFVAVPVVRAAKRLGIPVIIHESDMTPGLANKLSIPAAKAVCCNFPETAAYIPENKAVITGTPIRAELMNGNIKIARSLCGFNSDKPVLMIVGGSLGSAVLNDAIRQSLDALLESFQIIHICGKDKVDIALNNIPGYVQYEYIKEELPHMFALSDVIISRAGANSIFEICALSKPNLLIPLSAKASRGDQLLNAASFKKQGYSMVIEEEALTPSALLNAVSELYENRQSFIAAMKSSPNTYSVSVITELIKKYTK